MDAPGERSWKLRLFLLGGILLSLFAAGHYFEISERFSIDGVRELVLSAGVWGWLLYIAVFAAGEFFHVPGLVFVAAAILIYGKLAGFALAYLGAVISVCFSFMLVRRIGGTPLKQSSSPWLRRVLSRLDQQPIRTVFILRLFLWLAPPVNYVLALTPLRFSHYLIGSALGLVTPLAAAAVLFDWLITLL